MRNFYLLFIIITFLLCAQGFKGFCQTDNIYKKVSAIDTSKQDSLRKLVSFYALKANAEQNNQRNDTGYIFALLKIGSYETDLHNDIPKAINYTTQALHTLLSSHTNVSNLIVTAYYNLGILYYKISIYEQAKIFFEKTIEITNYRYLPEFYFGARMYEAVINDLLGDYEKAGKICQLVMAEAKSQYDSTSYISLLYLHCRSMVFQNQLEIALSEAKQLEEQAKQLSNNFYLANAYNLQANIYKTNKQYKVAELFFKLAFLTRLFLRDNEATVTDCSELVSLYVSGLQDYKQAEVYYEKSIQYGAKCPADGRAKVFLMIYRNLGNLYIKTKNYNKAVVYYNRALKVINVILPDFLSSNPSIRQLSAVGEKTQVLQILTSKCELLLSLYNKTKNKSDLQNCINTAITADSLIVQMRHEQTGDKSKLFWRDKTHEFFSEAMEACYLSGNIEKAFFFMEKSRSVLLNDKLNELSSTLSYLPQQMILSESKMTNELSELQTKLVVLSTSTPEYTNILKALEKKQDELTTYIKSLEKNFPLYYQYKYADDVPSPEDVNHYVKKNNQSLVYYFAGDSAMYALAITNNGTRFIKVPAQSFDSRQLSQFTSLCSNRQECNSNYKTFSSLAYHIYKELFEPLQLPNGRVVICTDNFFIPFDALCRDDKGKNFLLYNYNFSYAYSARALLHPFKSNAKPEGNFIGFAPVSFSQKLNVFPLNHSANALQKAAGYYKSNLLFINGNATRNTFFSQAAKYSVLTVFSHAQADTTDKEPVLYMQDSLIHLSELQMLKNPATQLVLLSACQTNTGKNATGEGIYSLARGFAAAGIPAVSATLWKADEETIYQISDQFNANLAVGMNKSDALQQAKIWYLQNSNREHALPFYWANLVLMGSSDPVTFTQSTRNWLWAVIIVIIVFSVLITTVGIYKKRRSVHRVADENI